MKEHFGHLRYAEPCAGDGSLINNMGALGAKCKWASDLVPRHKRIMQMDCFDVQPSDITDCNAVVTNPPFVTAFISAFVDHFLAMDKIVWIVVPVQWTCYANVEKQMRYCDRLVNIGPVDEWPNMPMAGTTYFCWLRFTQQARGIRYYGRPNV